MRPADERNPKWIHGPYEEKPTESEVPNQRKFDSIAAHKGHREVLLVFAPSPAKTPYKHLMRELDENRDDFEARGVELLIILDTGRPPREWNYLPGQQAIKARHKFHLGGSDFALILLGRDGRIKRQWDDAVDYDTVATALG